MPTNLGVLLKVDVNVKILLKHQSFDVNGANVKTAKMSAPCTMCARAFGQWSLAIRASVLVSATDQL